VHRVPIGHVTMSAPGIRRQLTLFVPPVDAGLLERVRAQVDPVQFRLIAAHVTLCREDEIVGLDEGGLANRLEDTTRAPLTLVFGHPVAVDGHGLLLPCIDGASAFATLRAGVLRSGTARDAAAHITLAHPRNPRSIANAPATYAHLPARMTVTFAAVSLIEQHGTDPWRTLVTLPLRTS
jgi:hypothetical protein